MRTSEVQSIDAGTSNTYSANIQPYQQVDLAFKSNGYLASMRQVKDSTGHVRNIDQGDWVAKGTVLATVDQGDYKERLQQANAQLARAQANYERAKLSFDRTSVLYQNGAATKPDYDNANAQMLDTQASIESAKASIAEATDRAGILRTACAVRWLAGQTQCGRRPTGRTGHQRLHHFRCAIGESGIRRARYGDGAHPAG